MPDAVVEDFSLQFPGICFRAGRDLQIYKQAGNQLILEETGGNGALAGTAGHAGLLVKHTHTSGYAYGFLCGAYSLVAVFVNSSIFGVGFVILLFLFVDTATQLDGTSKGKATRQA